LNDRFAEYTSGSGGTTLTFNYTVQAGDYTSDLAYISENAIDLNSGTIRDNGGNDATIVLPTPGSTGSLSLNKDIVIDTEPIVVNVSSSNADDIYGVGEDIIIEIEFNEIVNVETTGGTPRILLETGTEDQYIDYTSGTGSEILTFTYTVSPDDYNIDLDYANGTALEVNGGTIQDASLLDAILILPTPGDEGSLGYNKDIFIDGVGPVVTNISATNPDGTYGEGAVLNITVEFDEIVVVTGTPRLLLETGTTDNYANYNAGSGTEVLEFTYTIVNADVSTDLDYVADNSLELNGGTIQDVVANNANLILPVPTLAGSLSSNKAIVIDNTQPPIVLNVTCEDDYTIYGPTETVILTVTFSKNVVVNTAGGTPQLLLELGDVDSYATYTSNNGGTDLYFNYTIQEGDFSADLGYVATTSLEANGGTIQDAGALDAVLTLPTPGAANSLSSNKDIVVDGVASMVTNVTSPTNNGTYGIGSEITIDIEFDEIVVVETTNGTPQIQLETGTVDQWAVYSEGSGTSILSFLYTVQQNDSIADLGYTSTTAFTLNEGSITDEAGNIIDTTLITPGESNSLSDNKIITIDGVIPTVSSVFGITANGVYSSGDQIEIGVQFTEKVIVNDVTGTPRLMLNTEPVAYAYYVSGSGTNTMHFIYTVGSDDSSGDLDYTTTGDLTLQGATVKDKSNNTASIILPNVGTFAAAHGIIIDNGVPVGAITSDIGSYTNLASVELSLEFNERVYNLFDSDINITNGTVSSFAEVNVGRKWTINVAPTAEGEVVITVPAEEANDAAGFLNEEISFSFIYDATKPVMTIISEEVSPTVNKSFDLQVESSELIIGLELSDFVVSNAVLSNLTESKAGQTWTCLVTANQEGVVAIDLPAEAVSDSASNTNDAVTQFSIIYDESTPTVALTTIADSISNDTIIEVEIAFSENVIGFEESDIVLNNCVIDSIAAQIENKVWLAYVKPIEDGIYTFDIPAAVAHDTAGKDNLAAEQLLIRFDGTAPSFTIFTDSPTEINANTFTINVLASEEVTGFILSDLIVTNGTASNLNEITSGTEWSIDIRITSEGETTVNIEAEAAVDIAGNLSLVSNTLTVEYDATAPEMSNLSIENITQYTADFSFDVNESGTYYLVLDFATNLVPTVDDVINGTGYNGNDAVYAENASSLSGTNTINLIDLDARTDYTVYIVSTDGLSNASELGYINFTTLDVGIDGISIDNINIYPNPSEGIFTIDLNKYYNQNDVIKIQIVNNKGELILSKDILDEEINIDLTNHSSGLYYINIEKNGERLNIPIMIR
jgi:Bacterial Ig-like domain/Secretion system C-terminal sorting domain